MYLENCDTVLPMNRQTIVASRNEIGMAGPALRAMIGNANRILAAGAMCVTPWNTSSGRPSAFRRSCASAAGLAASAATGARWHSHPYGRDEKLCTARHNRYPAFGTDESDRASVADHAAAIMRETVNAHRKSDRSNRWLKRYLRSVIN